MSQIMYYPESIKIHAVKKIVDRQYTMSQMARKLRVDRTTVSRWVKKYCKHKNKITSAQKRTRILMAECERLQKQLIKVEKEKLFLKSVAIYFAIESSKLTN